MKVLIVEDDVNIATLVKNSLASCSHTVEIAADGAEGAFLGKSYEYDAIILDNSLPKKDGLTVCSEIRTAGRHTPILFLSVDGEEETKVEAFRRGADDYIVKPFFVDELTARIDAVTRRAGSVKRAILSAGDLTIDLNNHTVTRAGRLVRLTRKEFHLLEYLLRHIGMVMSRAQLMEHIWTADGNPFSNTIEAHVCNLRNKLNAGGLPNMLGNVPGRGYVIDVPDAIARL